jgi:demethylmenaquinone methyltransferase/2-methoxy-6-polyprenyl-1,4-benzoquinol methylase
MFASVAPTYDLLNHLHSANIDRWWRSRTVALSEVPAGARVLDLCCGTGDLTLAYADGAPQAERVVGSDFCHEMLALGRAKLPAFPRDRAAGGAGRTPPVALVEADALDLPFPDAAFDVVSCAFGMRNLSDLDRGLAECRRVLRPGGRLVILEFTMPRMPLLRAMYEFYFQTVMPLAATIISGDRTGAYRYLPKSVLNWKTAEELEGRLRSAGFADVDHTPLTFGIAAVHRGRKPAG